MSGEVCTRGYHVMTGYFRDPDKTAAIDADGWLHTGDLAAMDERGYCQIAGREDAEREDAERRPRPLPWRFAELPQVVIRVGYAAHRAGVTPRLQPDIVDARLKPQQIAGPRPASEAGT